MRRVVFGRLTPTGPSATPTTASPGGSRPVASEAARQKYPRGPHAYFGFEQEAYDAGRADELRNAAQIVQDVARQGGGLQTAEEALRREADRIEKEQTGGE